MAVGDTDRLPTWVFGVLCAIGLLGIFYMALDPHNLVPDDQAGLLLGTVTGAVLGLLGPGALKRF